VKKNITLISKKKLRTTTIPGKGSWIQYSSNRKQLWLQGEENLQFLRCAWRQYS